MYRKFCGVIASLGLLVLPFLFTPESAAQKGKVADPPEVVQDDRIGRAIVKGQLLVTLHKDVKLDDLKPIFERFDAKFDVVDRIESIRQYVLATDHERLPELKQRLENHPYIAAAGFNGVTQQQRVFNDPVFKKPMDKFEDKDNWGLVRINAPDAWDITTGGATVAVIDSGAKLDHEELVGRTTADPFSFATNSPTMQEGMKKLRNGRSEEVRNHGTHVAITIGGKADNGVGTAGVAPTSPLMILQALYYQENPGDIRGFNNAVNKAMAMALERNAAVMNLSLGGVSDELKNKWRAATSDEERADISAQFLRLADDDLKNRVAPLLDQANRQGTIIVTSAGNDDLPAEFEAYALSRRTISVAATTRKDTRCNFTNYGDLKKFGWGSNYGPFTTVSAPGHDIWSGWADPNKAYVYLEGTSMACPHAAGVVALMKTIDPGLKVADVAAILIKTGRMLDTDQPIGPLINAKLALEETQRRLKEKVREPELPPLIETPGVNPTEPTLPDDGIAILRRPNPWTDPNVQRLIRVWLAFADAPPPPGAPGNLRFFFNLNGQIVNNRTVMTVPRPVWFQFNYRWLWENANALNSPNMGSLYEFTVGSMRLRKFDPVATRVPGNVRPRKDDPQPPAKVLPADPGLGTTKWDAKNDKGETVKFEFDGKRGVTLTRDGKPTHYAVRVNPYVHPMTIDLFPGGGAAPVRGLLHMNDKGEVTLCTDFTSKRPQTIAANDPRNLGLKRTDTTKPVAAVARGFQDDDGKAIDPRFAKVLVSDGTTDCAGDCGKFAGNNASAGPRTGIASKNLSLNVPVVGHHWVVRKFADASSPKAYIAKMAKDPRFTTPSFDNGMAGFVVKARNVGADSLKDTIESYAKIGNGFEQSSHMHTFVYRGFLVTYSLWEPRRGHDFTAESQRITERTKKLIDERFPE